jgi:hypothetical protein
LGAATNLITINQLDEAVLLMYRSGAWMLADNISYVEPIFFSGTNAAANAAASRENLGLGIYSNVEFGNINITGTNGISFDEVEAATATRTNLGLGAANDVLFKSVAISGSYSIRTNSNSLIFVEPANEDTVLGLTYETNPVYLNPNYWNSSGVRSNLGLPLVALTNTNNANFQAAVFSTNSNPTNAGNFNNHVAWMEVTVQTNGSNVSFRVPLYQ